MFPLHLFIFFVPFSCFKLASAMKVSRPPLLATFQSRELARYSHHCKGRTKCDHRAPYFMLDRPEVDRLACLGRLCLGWGVCRGAKSQCFGPSSFSPSRLVHQVAGIVDTCLALAMQAHVEWSSLLEIYHGSVTGSMLLSTCVLRNGCPNFRQSQYSCQGSAAGARLERRWTFLSLGGCSRLR